MKRYNYVWIIEIQNAYGIFVPLSDESFENRDEARARLKKMKNDGCGLKFRLKKYISEDTVRHTIENLSFTKRENLRLFKEFIN